MSKFFGNSVRSCVLVLLLCALSPGFASAAQSAGEKAVARAVEHIRTAILKADRASLETIGLPSMTWAHTTGRVETNAQFVDNLVNKGTVFNELTFSDIQITVDKNIAVVRHMLDSKHVVKGKALEGHFMVLLVFKKTDKGWKVVVRQGYPAPKL